MSNKNQRTNHPTDTKGDAPMSPKTRTHHVQAPVKAAQIDATETEIVRLPERFDAFAQVELPGHLASQGRSIIVDARAVRFADLHALQSLVDARIVLLDAGAEMVIQSPSNEMRATLELTGFDQLLHISLDGAQ